MDPLTMSIRSTVLFVGLAASAALADTDVIASCRAAHADNPAAHIDCLERALQARDVDGLNRSLGAEQLRSGRESDDGPEQVEVRIASVSYSDEGRGLFATADGQLWRETERSPRSQRLWPGHEYSARIERGVLGGYRMYVDGVRRMIKVERLR
jgi:hypothetical protein